VLHDIQEHVATIATDFGLDERGSMIGTIAGGLMEADNDEIRILCDDEEYLTRRIQEIAPSISRDDYSDECTEAHEDVRHHMWKHVNRPLTPDERASVIYHKVRLIAPKYRRAAGQIAARMLHRNTEDLQAMMGYDTMLKLRVSKQILDILASDPNGDEKDPFVEPHGDVNNRSHQSL